MKAAIKIRLLISMLLVGILFGITFYFLTDPLDISALIHCLFMGIIFGLLNYFICYEFIKKYILLKRDNESLKHDIKTDTLTGLYNRRAFDEDLKNISYNDLYSMIFIDIDNFRKFNNDYGHQAGDDVLRKVSTTILKNITLTDKAYRYGGEEIVILLTDTEKQNAFMIAEKIRKSIEQLDNKPNPRISVSIGLSSYPSDGFNSVEILKSCDNALLAAKDSGKNQTFVF